MQNSISDAAMTSGQSGITFLKYWATPCYRYTPYEGRFVSSLPAEVRRGKGKGAVDFWAARIPAGQVFFE